MAEGAANGNGNGNGYLGRASLYVSLISAAAILISAIVWVGGIANEVTQNQGALAAQEGRIKLIETDLKANDLTTANMARDNCQIAAKVETQMGTVETVINEMHVEQIRDHGVMWGKIFGEVQPSIYYEIKIPHEVMPC